MTQPNINEVWLDRYGNRWKILSTDDSRLFPVLAGRWEGKRYCTRNFQRDGHYVNADTHLDLIKRVSEDPS